MNLLSTAPLVNLVVFCLWLLADALLVLQIVQLAPILPSSVLGVRQGPFWMLPPNSVSTNVLLDSLEMGQGCVSPVMPLALLVKLPVHSALSVSILPYLLKMGLVWLLVPLENSSKMANVWIVKQDVWCAMTKPIVSTATSDLGF